MIRSKKNKILIYSLLCFFIIMCNKSNNQTNYLFNKHKLFDNSPYLKIDTNYNVLDDNLFRHSFSIVTAEIAAADIIYGELWKDGQKIIAKISVPFETDIFNLFDFSLNINDSIDICWDIFSEGEDNSESRQKKYFLKLENKFFDPAYSDTIYKFRFIDYGYYTNSDDLVFFLGLNTGIVGSFHGDVLYKPKYQEYIYYSFGELYKNRIDYSKVDFSYRIE